MSFQSSAAEMAWLVLHLGRNRALAAAKTSATQRSALVQDVAGLGKVGITCWREEVQRARGPKMRSRFAFALNGTMIKEKALYERLRALTDEQPSKEQA